MGQRYSEWGQVKMKEPTRFRKLLFIYRGRGPNSRISCQPLGFTLQSGPRMCSLCGLGALSFLESKASHFLYLACTLRIH